jgi:hypothetical protein
VTLDDLRVKAQAVLVHSDNIGEDWFGEQELRSLLIANGSPDAPYIAAASPQQVLKLIAAVEAAKKALAALEEVTQLLDVALGVVGRCHPDGPAAKARDAIAALRSALKELE